MPVAISNAGRIRTNTPAENAYNSLRGASDSIALRQLRLSTGKRINSASDDVAGYITSRSLGGRVTSLRSAVNAVGDAKNVTSITQDGLSNISSLLTQIQQSTATAASGALGTDEKVALAQSAYRLVQQIQTVVDSTVFGGRALLGGSYSGDFDWIQV
jgi:flagellin